MDRPTTADAPAWKPTFGGEFFKIAEVAIQISRKFRQIECFGFHFSARNSPYPFILESVAAT
jgi:hypothetical protein